MKQNVAFIMGMGGPDSVDAIEPFLFNLFSDRDIINFHTGSFIQKFIAKKISKSRSKKLAPLYMKMGFGGASPQNYFHKKIFKQLEISYKNKTGIDLKVIEANCYYKPYFEDALKELKNTDFNEVIFTTVYPQYSMTTVEACFNRLRKMYNIEGNFSCNNRVIPFWFENVKYNTAIAERIKKSAEKLGKNLSECHVLYSAHSVPLSYVENGDIYPEHIKRHTDIINKMLNISSYSISYQSKVGPVKWLAPSTKDTITALVEKNVDNIIIVPISFISDHIETLIEIDEQLMPVAKNAGKNIVRSESLNDSEDFIDALTDIITGEK